MTFRVGDLTASDAEQSSGELTQAEAEAQVVETLKAPPTAKKPLLNRCRHRSF